MTERTFDPRAIDVQKAASFFRIWERLIASRSERPPFQDHVLVALQGKLTRHRRGQAMSPVQMVQTTLAHEPERQIVLKLHPKETYSTEDEDAVAELLAHPRVHLFDGALEDVLTGAAYVVTMNSSVVLKGLFWRLPAVLFADCEYHHAFHSLRRGVRAEDAFDRVRRLPPEVEAFAYWYFQLNCINTSRDWAGEQILTQVREFGWRI